MATRTKEEWMDELARQLQGSSMPIANATRLTKSEDNAQDASPYVGVISTYENSQIQDEFDERYLSGITLVILTKETVIGTSIETIIESIKTLIRTIDLGDNVYQVNFIGSDLVSVEDNRDDDGSDFSNTSVNLEVIWSHNFVAASNATNPAEGLTEPLATAHYKVYALLYSGSAAFSGSSGYSNSYPSQPLGIDVYPSHIGAAVSMPRGSGSIFVGALTDSPYADSSGYSDALMDHHRIQLVVDIPTAYAKGKANLRKNMRLVDDVVDKLRKNIDLGGYYKIVNDVPAFDVLSIVDELPESATIGSRIIVTVSRFYDYEQE
ncbi:hypothetical protein LCGC14_1034080 [marine sediment metagenome]|uniref:Uncharacterized protein n=1 Tax=marine sediment metagenome TaxID=412755 RepID=A0A0F9QBV6_9ZZZZ